MSEPRYVSPMLDGFTLGQSISDHSGVSCYPAMRDDSEKRYIVKKISLPASQVQVEALLLTGVFRDAEAVRSYYEELAHGVTREIQTLNSLAEQRGFVPCDGFQVEPMEDGVGYEVHMLTRYRMTLERYMHRNPMTQLSALNLGIDLCAAMAVSRESGWMYVDLKPENVYLFGDQEYRIGDLGFVAMDSLKYASLPDRYRSAYTAPEVGDAYATLNATMDTYALGLVLYQIYNLGKLPFTDADSRKAWLEKLSSGEAMEPPIGADEEMAAIITKACAYDPADRWQTPAELGHALISYMQRNGAEDIPITAPAQPEEEAPAEVEAAPEEAEAAEIVEEIPSEAPVEQIVVEESTEESAEEEVIVEVAVSEEEPFEEIVEESVEESDAEDPVVEEIPAEEPVAEEAVEETVEETEIPAEEPEEAPVNADWIDLMDAFLAEEEDENAPEAAEDEPTLRELLGGEEALTGEDAALTEEELSAEAADILSVAQELIDHEAPAPVVAPEPIDVPIPEPISLEPEEEEAPLDLDAMEEEEDAPAEETPAEPAAEQSENNSVLKKILKAAVALALVAGLAFGAWFYYQNIYLQTIDGMTYEGTATAVTVNVDTQMDESKLTVICKDTYGNAVNGALQNGVVTFSDLVPGTQYIISLEPVGFHKLVGSTSVTYSTPAETKLIHLNAVTGQEAGSAIISFGVEGRDCENWTLIYSTEGEETREIAFTGHTVTVGELTVGAEYIFTVTSPDDIILVGENIIIHTASELVQASNLALTAYADGALTVSWTAPEGVDRWIVRCFDDAGYDQLQEVTGNTATFEGVTEGSKYTVEVTAATMTLGTRAEITADASNISGFTATLNSSTIELSWSYGGPAPEGGWQISWSADGGAEHILTAEEMKTTLSPAAPGAVYSFTVLPPAGTTVAAAVTTLETPAAGKFSANKLDSDTIIVEMFDVPSKSNWSYGTLLRAKEKDTFKPGGSMALLYTVTKPYTFDSAEFETIFVIRDAEGKLVSTSARTRSWDDMWDNGYCTEQVSNLPADAGSYTLSIYIQNGLLAELPFTVK